MKKTIMIIVLFAVLIGLGTAATIHAVDGKKGSKAPVFKVEANDTIVSLDDMKGHWVLLQFWATSDAKSRISTKQYSDLIRTNPANRPSERFRFLAINMDRSEKLFKEIAKRDGMDEKAQFHVAGKKAGKLVKDYHLENGMHSYLINPQGKIVAKDPTKQQLIDFAVE